SAVPGSGSDRRWWRYPRTARESIRRRISQPRAVRRPDAGTGRLRCPCGAGDPRPGWCRRARSLRRGSAACPACRRSEPGSSWVLVDRRAGFGRIALDFSRGERVFLRRRRGGGRPRFERVVHSGEPGCLQLGAMQQDELLAVHLLDVLEAPIGIYLGLEQLVEERILLEPARRRMDEQAEPEVVEGEAVGAVAIVQHADLQIHLVQALRRMSVVLFELGLHVGVDTHLVVAFQRWVAEE